MGKFKPGNIAPYSGQAKVYGPRGADKGVEVTVVRGERFPPTPKAGQTYRIVDRTRHKGR